MSLGALVRWVLPRRRAVWAATAAVVLVSAAVGLPPRIDPDLSRLLPPGEPHAQALRAVAERGGANGVHLSFTDPDPVALDALAAELEALPEVAWARHRLEPDTAVHLAAMQLEPGSIEDLAKRTRMALAMGTSANPMVLKGIFGDALPALDPDALPIGAADTVFVKPTGSNLDPDVAVATVAAIRKVVAAHPELELAFEGGPFSVVADGVVSTRSDLAKTSVVSAFLVWLVLAIGLPAGSLRGRLLGPAALLVPVVVAALANLAFARLAFGALNAYTAIGTALLLGLGVDIGIHLGRRVAEEGGVGRAQALERAWDATGPACVTAALTSAAGFAALGLANFQGMAQLGWILASGMLLCLGSMLVLLPLLLPEGAEIRTAAASAQPVRPWARPVWTLAVVAALALAALRPGPTLDPDFSSLGRNDRAYAQQSPEEQERTRHSYPPLVYDCDSPEAAAATADTLVAALEAGSLPHVRRIVSADRLLPADQASRVAALSDLKRALAHPSFRALPAPVREALAPLADWTPGERAITDLPAPVRDLVDDGRRVLVLADGPLHDMRRSGELMDAMDAAAGPAASEQLVQGVLYRLIQADAWRLIAATAGLVLLLIAADLRHLGWTLAAAGSLAAGLVAAAGLLQLTGVPLTIANVAGLPMLLGLGVDVVLHLVHRIREHGDVGLALRTSGWAALISTATTLVSFVALGVASAGGVRSLGQLMTVGLPTVAAVAAAAVALSAWAWASPQKSGNAPPR